MAPNRTNLNGTEQGLERPDSVISVTMQSNWGESLGYGEAKIAEPTDNKFMLAWDLCRLGYFSKEAINTTNNESSISFQVKGHSISIYTTTLIADGIYTMIELFHIQIPQSVESLELLTTQSAYVFEKIRLQKEKGNREILSHEAIWTRIGSASGISIRQKRQKTTLYITLLNIHLSCLITVFPQYKTL